ncbi:MAG: metabolite traffic protein EboE [Planctomycetota bacterium]|nr:metabolite traffic protein EboE [Planctomycetota bacterium]
MTRLTYCGNVHPSETLDGWIEACREHALPVAEARRAAGVRRFGLGAWWTAEVAAELVANPSARERVEAFLREADVELWTLNVFPYRGFHDPVVKEAVYRPDWADPARLRYTVDAARAAASLVAPGEVLPLSTLPLGYDEGDLDGMARALRRCGEEFAAIEAETGVRPVLALEPEPFCLEETVSGVATFLEGRVLRGASPAEESALRRHVGVCIDLCHLAVVGEDPVDAFLDLGRRGLAVPKIQVSSCVELRSPATHLDALLAFDEPRYLHQTVSDRGARASDLAEVRARRAEFEAADRVRTHFHLPVFWDDPDAPLGSTRAEMVRFLTDCPGPLPLIEIETYTWSVLGDAWLEDRSLSDRIVEELGYVARILGQRG